MRPPRLFDPPPADYGPALDKARDLAILRHRDGRDYSTFTLAPTTTAEPEPLALLDLDAYAAPNHGPAPLAGQLDLTLTPEIPPVFELWNLYHVIRQPHDGRPRYGEPANARRACAWLAGPTQTYGPALIRQLAWRAPCHVTELAQEQGITTDKLIQSQEGRITP